MNKTELIQAQASYTWQALQVGLENYRIYPGVDYDEISVHNSPMLLSYTMSMIDTSKWNVIKNLVPELSQIAQLPKDQKVRVSYEGMKYRIEVPKPSQLHDTVTINDIIKGTNRLGVSFGVSAYDGVPNLVDFEPDTAGHMLVSGSTRCGKTNILRIIAMCLASNNSPDKVRFAIIDTKKSKKKYGALENSAHLATEILNTDKKVIAFLEWVKRKLDKLDGFPFSHKIIIIVDEVYWLLKNKQIKDLITNIASSGGESGFHIVAATQYTKVEDTGGSQFKGNLMTRVTGRVADYYASINATGKEKAGAENLMGVGDFLVTDENGINRIAVPEMTDNMFNHIERGMSPIAKLNWTEDEAESVGKVSSRAPNIQECFEKIDERLLNLAIKGRIKGRPLGPDKIREASYILAEKGLGKRIGQSFAQEYVKFAQLYRTNNPK